MSCCPPSITPDFAGGGDSGGGGGGGVQSVGAGTNITISGTPTNPVVNALAGVSAVEGLQGSINLVGQNCSITAAGQDITITVPAIPPSGVQAVSVSGPGLTQSGTATNPILTNSGVISITTPTNNGSGLAITNGGVGAVQMSCLVESGNGCVVRPSTSNGSLFIDNGGITGLNNLVGEVVLSSSDGSVVIEPNGQTLNFTTVSKEAPVQSVGGLTGAITFSSSDSTIVITPSGSNIDLKATGGGTAAPNVNTPALQSFEASNQNVVGFPESGQVYMIFSGTMSSPLEPAWSCTARFIKFDFYIPIIRTLTASATYANPVNETLTFLISPSLNYTPPVQDASKLTITQSTGLTTNNQTNNFVLQGSILCDRQAIDASYTQFFMWVQCQTDSTDQLGWIAYTLKQDTTNNWCVATPIYN